MCMCLDRPELLRTVREENGLGSQPQPPMEPKEEGPQNSALSLPKTAKSYLTACQDEETPASPEQAAGEGTSVSH